MGSWTLVGFIFGRNLKWILWSLFVCILAIYKYVPTPYGGQAVCACVWRTSGLKAVVLFERLSCRKHFLHYILLTLFSQLVSYIKLGLHDCGLCVEQYTHKKIKGLCFSNEDWKPKSILISQHVFLDLLYIRSVQEAAGKYQRNGMSFLAMGDKTHTYQRPFTKQHVINKFKPVWHKLRTWVYDAFYLRLPWTRVSTPGSCSDKATFTHAAWKLWWEIG